MLNENMKSSYLLKNSIMMKNINDNFPSRPDKQKSNILKKELFESRISSKKRNYDKMNKLDQMKALNEENHHLKEILIFELKDKTNTQDKEVILKNNSNAGSSKFLLFRIIKK